MQNAIFGGGEVSKKAFKKVSRRVSKNRLPKIHEQVTFWGSVLAPFLALGPPLGHFVALLWPLGPRGPKREAQEQPKGGQERPKSRPREAKRDPGEAKREPKVPQESPREAQESPRAAKRGTRQAQERPREAKTGQESPKKRPREPTTA